ncbi:ABC transporter permease [Chelatococcus asaccharovorans]|uniref:ABC transporter permease n=1 Tax=Chelatococcus asaccharovorans TaxID=28210 RepID=UPI00224C6383|nr:ABC transporter permease subunit [Chelatococcus asaccharovorans]CAH1665213.1 putative ABC transporter permease protein y4fN [Chelatococcus asaccharovorans]CAH1682061.1 putative ABC transporter permease protein y4fN [Chelatococcus asaccharovorans]
MSSTLCVGKIARLIALLAIGWMVIAFLFYPVVYVLLDAFFPNGQFSAGAIERLTGSPRVTRSIWSTILVAIVTVVTVNVVGLFQVAVLEFFKVRLAPLLLLAFSTPLVFSSVAAVSGYNFVYSSHGFLTKVLLTIFPDMNPNWFTGAFAVIFVHTFTMTGYHILFVRAGLRQIDFSIVEAAQSLGVSPARAFLKIVLPMLAPVLLATSLLVLLGALNSFAAPSMLGGRDFYMLSSMIQSLVSLGRTDMAALLSLLLGAISLMVFLWMKRIERRGSTISTSKTQSPLRKTEIRNRPLNLAVHVIAYLLFLIYTAPILITVAFSFATTESIVQDPFPTRFTLQHYTTVFSDPRAFGPLGNSLVLSCLAVSAALAVSLFAALRIRASKGIVSDSLEFSLFIPWVLPSIMLAVGLIAAYGKPSMLIFGASLVGTYWLLPIAYVIVIIPMMVRMLGAALAGIDPNIDDAGRSLGASGMYRFTRLTAPLLAPVIALVAAISFNELLSEYTLSVFLYNINNTPLGVALQNAARADGPDQIAISMVYVVLLLTFSLIVILASSRLGSGRAGRT